MLAKLGRTLARWAWLVAVVWAAFAAVGYLAAVSGFFVGDTLFDRVSTGELRVPSESQRGQDILEDVSPSGTTVSLILEGVDPKSPKLAGELKSARADLGKVDGVKTVLDPIVAGPAFVSSDGDGVLVTVQFDPAASSAVESAAIDTVTSRLSAVDDAVLGSSGRLTGGPILEKAITDQVQKDLVIGEAVALPLSLLVMVLIFGGLAAAGVPLVAAIASIAGGLASLLGFTYVMNVEAAVVNVVTVLGLGLCIDYSLLIVSRYREELLALGNAPEDVPTRSQRAEATARTLATAGRTVIFSTITVAVSVAGLMFFDIDVIRAVGAAAASVVLVALLVSLTLVPALAVLASRWIARPGVLRKVPGLRALTVRLGDVAPAEGAFSRLADRVQRRPWLWTVVAAALLLVLAIPAVRLDLRNSGAELLPPDNAARVAFEDMQQQFPATSVAPVSVLGRASASEAAGYRTIVSELPGVSEVGEPRAVGGGYVRVDVSVDGPSQGATAQSVVRALRAERPDFETWVIGDAAALVDFKAGIRAGLPWALGVVIGATFLLLFLMTGSVLIPIKALLMSLLSLGATFGALVWIFQDGRWESLLGFSSVGGLESFIPVLVFAFAFGLAMDYEVFLLSRIKEFRDAGMDNDAAVRAGLQRTGRIITAAAFIIALVFAGFVLGDLLVIKETGVALAFAVLLDATIVRIVLVPATMTILGEWNWWAPGPLRRFYERFGVSEHAPESPAELGPEGARMPVGGAHADAPERLELEHVPAAGDESNSPDTGPVGKHARR